MGALTSGLASVDVKARSACSQFLSSAVRNDRDSESEVALLSVCVNSRPQDDEEEDEEDEEEEDDEDEDEEEEEEERDSGASIQVSREDVVSVDAGTKSLERRRRFDVWVNHRSPSAGRSKR